MTIVIRKDGTLFNVTGPIELFGGYPIFADRERDGSFGRSVDSSTVRLPLRSARRNMEAR